MQVSPNLLNFKQSYDIMNVLKVVSLFLEQGGASYAAPYIGTVLGTFSPTHRYSPFWNSEAALQALACHRNAETGNTVSGCRESQVARDSHVARRL